MVLPGGAHRSRLLPGAVALLAFAACTPAQYVSTTGPRPAACTDSITARVARLPAESVTVADREHALWAQEECKTAIATQARAEAEARTARRTPTPPASCTDTIVARVSRTPADSVSARDRQYAAAAQQDCRRALAAGPPAGYAPSSWPPPPCVDSIAARVAKMPPDSVSAADRQHAADARDACERELTASPASPSNPASEHGAAAIAIGAALLLVMLVVL